MTLWTSEAQGEVARLLMAGRSFSEIAGVFETTRSAVAGVVHRNRMLRLMPRPARLVGRPPRITKPARKPMTRKADTPPAQAAMPARIHPPKPPAMRRIGLLELSRSDCRWPVEEDPDVIGGQLFCGGPTIDTYCEFHAAVAYAGKGKGYG